MYPILPPSFWSRPTLEVARNLLGKTLVRRFQDGTTRALRITEVEAYDGPDDKASHASTVMRSIVTGPKDYPAALLIRGLEGITGPARLTKALKIDRTLNTLPATEASGLWFEDRGEKVGKIKTTPRIGVDYAGEWKGKEWRFTCEKVKS